MLLSMEEFRAFQPKKPTYALFGWPLGHTMSPELHAQLFEASGQDAAYIGVAVPPDDLAEAFDLAKAKLRGINCTIPHKKAVIELLDGVDTAARDKEKPKKNITEFVYSYGEKYYAAYCPNEKAAELKKALADIFGTEPEEYKK